MLTKTDIAELLELADWLETQPDKSAFSGAIALHKPHLRHWTEAARQSKRSHSKIIYYQTGYGWRLNRQWKSNLGKQTALINQIMEVAK
jgi:hypothetical protein